MKDISNIVVLIAVASEEEARGIAELLLNERIAACVNIVPKVDSLFWWQGELDSTQESLLIIKSRASLLPQIVEVVKEVHSYEVPEIIALPVIGGSEDYLSWVSGEVKEG